MPFLLFFTFYIYHADSPTKVYPIALTCITYQFSDIFNLHISIAIILLYFSVPAIAQAIVPPETFSQALHAHCCTALHRFPVAPVPDDSDNIPLFL